MRLPSGDYCVLATSMLNEQLYCIHAQHLRPPMAVLQDYPESAPFAPLWLHRARQRSALPEHCCVAHP